jgi:hypothetical protein
MKTAADVMNRSFFHASPSDTIGVLLQEMLREPQDDEGLEAILEAYPRSVRFRCLTMHDEAQREQLAGALCNVGDGAGHARPASVEADASPRTPDRPRALPLAVLDS